MIPFLQKPLVVMFTTLGLVLFAVICRSGPQGPDGRWHQYDLGQWVCTGRGQVQVVEHLMFGKLPMYKVSDNGVEVLKTPGEVRTCWSFWPFNK